MRISPTSLSRWFSLGCPAAWHFERTWSSHTPDPIFEVGKQVHRLLEGKLAPTDVTDRRVLTIFRKLIELKSALGLTVVLGPDQTPLVELKQVWRLMDEVDFVRKLDILATLPDGKTIIVDWKSHLGYGWKQLVGPNYQTIAPQALTFQSPGYLLAPPKELLEQIGLKEWPTIVYYLVGPIRGAAQTFIYEWRQDDENKLIEAIKHLAETINHNLQFKVYGQHCLGCPVGEICFETPGWQSRYYRWADTKDETPDLDGGAG